MKKEDIERKAGEAFPGCPMDSLYDYDQELRREGYVRGMEDALDMPSVRGWAVRDTDGQTLFYAGTEMPVRFHEDWMAPQWTGRGTPLPLDGGLFPGLTWESEPLEVRLVICAKR